MDKPFYAMACDQPVVRLWAEKLSPLCNQRPEICEVWLAAFLTAVRLARCEGLPEERRRCEHYVPAQGAMVSCLECVQTLAKREGHTEAGVYWTAGEVMERASRTGVPRV